jgi:hypothetical protein
MFTISSIIGVDNAKKLISYANNAAILIILLGLFYIIVIIFDRLSDALFQPLENTHRKKSGLQTKSVMLLPFNKTQYEFMVYSRSRMRILRASIINSLFAMISSIFFISIHMHINKTGLICFSIVFFAFVICVSFLSLNKMLKNIYDKAKVFEMSMQG